MVSPYSHNRLFLIPLDSRPVCYDLPRRLADVAGIELSLPSPRLLSALKQPGDRKALGRWIKNHLFEGDPVIAALDTVAYGGLIPGRVNTDPLSALEAQVEQFFSRVRSDCLFGFSSILRIPAYNNDEEEPEYWTRYGKRLYQYSARLHQSGQADATGIPEDVLADFLARRHKNHMLNQGYVQRLVRRELQYLSFCQDDTGPYGLNVQEAEELAGLLKKNNCTGFAHVQTGADEVASCMLARWFVFQRGEAFRSSQSGSAHAPEKPIRVYPLYSDEAGREYIARFDGISIGLVVEQAVQACGGVLTEKPDEADLWFLVHTPHDKQGDHASNISANVQSVQSEVVLNTLKKARRKKKPLALADVAYANGSDPLLIQRLIQEKTDFSALYGYAGWNTPGNTIGTAMAMAFIRLVAEEFGTFKAGAFARLMLIRLADDWLYQSDVRYTMRSLENGRPPETGVLNARMSDGLALLKERLGLSNTSVECRFPCQRTFEIEVVLS